MITRVDTVRQGKEQQSGRKRKVRGQVLNRPLLLYFVDNLTAHFPLI